jgi:5-methylcytosine-specific restriction endonuclease McrA
MRRKYNNKFHYKKKFVPHSHKTPPSKRNDVKRKKLYTENWDVIRKRVYQRDGWRCVMCGKKGKLHAHHIVPVAISKDNSMSNLVSVCEVCHRKLEEVGFKILQEGGHRSDVRRVELKMIAEAKQSRRDQLNE